MKPGIDYPGVCAVFFVHDGKGNFLMAKRGVKSRDERGKWDIGGGKIDLSSQAEETVAKEIREEYGIDPERIEFLGYRDVHRLDDDGNRTHWVALDFKVLAEISKARNAEPHKFDDIAVFTADALPPAAELHSTVPVIFKKYGSRLR